MRHSIRFRLILTLTVLIIFTWFMCWFMNKTFLPKYYQYSKMHSLGSMYTEVSRVFEDLDGTEDSKKTNEAEEAELALEKLGADKNISLYIVDLVQLQYGERRMYIGRFIYPSNLNDIQQNQVTEQIGKYYNQQFGQEKDGASVYKDNQYEIIKSYDDRIGSYYLELCGTISVNEEMYTVYMRTNYESIQESAIISNRFLIYAGISAAFLGVIIMFFISRSFTEPILELSKIAQQMSDLNFERKYQESRQDEVGQLGNSINVLSEKLESTISELKTANNELKTDIENKIQIDEMRKEFLSNVSHELKTPIALIQGYAEGLKENINDDQESRDFYCEVIMDEANKMNKMVKKLLSLNQLEFGNNQIQFERFDIVSLIKTVLNSTEILFQQKEATLIMENYDSVYVWADEFMVEEVVTNYISNALNHVDGKRFIEVKLIRKEDVVRVSVFNTGELIPEDELDKVWIKFYKVDKARTREYGGSGIGLSIVKAIMTSLNRECGVCNHHNGVEFWFELDIS